MTEEHVERAQAIVHVPAARFRFEISPVVHFRIDESHVEKLRGLVWLKRKLQRRPTEVTIIDHVTVTGISLTP